MKQLIKLQKEGKRIEFNGIDEAYLLGGRIWLVVDSEITKTDKEFWDFGMAFVREISRNIFGQDISESIISESGTTFITYDNVGDDVCDLISLNSIANSVLPDVAMEYLNEHPELEKLDDTEVACRLLTDCQSRFMEKLKEIYNTKKRDYEGNEYIRK